MKHNLALITGASSGIGEALAVLLFEKGVKLIITGRDKTSLEALGAKLGPDTQLIVADLTHPEDRRIVIEQIHEQKPDLLINNAGQGLYGPALNHTVADQQKLIDLNVSVVQQLTLEAGKMMVENKVKGTILNVSSAACFLPMPYFSVYAATKAFVTQLSESLDFEFKRHGVRVLTACPGVVRTRFRQRAGGKQAYDRFMTMTQKFAAKQIWKQICSGKRVRIFDWKYRVLIFIGRYLVPHAVGAAVTRRRMKEIMD